jgi:outer membrane protein TolC
MSYTPWAPFGAAGRTGFFGPSLGALTFSQDWPIYVGWQIGPGGILDVPAIRGRSLRIQGAKVGKDALRARIVREVAEARAETVAAQGRLDAARAGMRAASEGLRLTMDRFVKGVAIQLEVLDAEDAFVRARLALVESTADFDVAQYRLLRATGTTPP